MLIEVIFLDIDGVLNPDKAEYEHVFAPDCVAQLRRVLEARPKARIVFTTAWRTGFSLFHLGWLWRQHGLPFERVLGRTPDIDLERRGDEIRSWLDDAPHLPSRHQVRRYAVLEDMGTLLAGIPAESVFLCDPFNGLTKAIATKVIRHLGST